MSRIFKGVICVVGCLLVASGTMLWAQADRGTITGTVTDPCPAP